MKLETALKPFQKGEHQVYCCGLPFMQNYPDLILLMKKSHPSWQAGFLNGIGGKLEEGELPHQAMVREFKEEAGIETKESDWEIFAVITGPDYAVVFFKAFLEPNDFFDAKGCEDEEINPISIQGLNWIKCVPNLKALISMAQRPDWEMVHIRTKNPDEAKQIKKDIDL